MCIYIFKCIYEDNAWAPADEGLPAKFEDLDGSRQFSYIDINAKIDQMHGARLMTGPLTNFQIQLAPIFIFVCIYIHVNIDTTRGARRMMGPLLNMLQLFLSNCSPI